MYDFHRKSLLYLKSFIVTSPIALKYSTATNALKRQALRLSYLINKCGFSAEVASKLSKKVTFMDSEKPNAVLELLRNLNISDSQLRATIKRAPDLLSIDPVNIIKPKLDFFKSKGASSSELAQIIIMNPWSLQKSLENHIIPSFDLVKSFLHSDQRTLKTLTACPSLITDYGLAKKIKLLQDHGVPYCSISRVFHHWPLVMNYPLDELASEADEVKEMGFDPSKISFTEALRAKVVVGKSRWERKVELYKKWGWSDEATHKAFIKRPCCMLKSERKIEAVMEFFVNYMGWDSLVLSENPLLFSFSLEKRIIPRASVLKFLQSRDLIEKQPSANPFYLSEDKFHRRFVSCFKDESPELLKLYGEKLRAAYHEHALN